MSGEALNPLGVRFFEAFEKFLPENPGASRERIILEVGALTAELLFPIGDVVRPQEPKGVA